MLWGGYLKVFVSSNEGTRISWSVFMIRLFTCTSPLINKRSIFRAAFRFSILNLRRVAGMSDQYEVADNIGERLAHVEQAVDDPETKRLRGEERQAQGLIQQDLPERGVGRGPEAHQHLRHIEMIASHRCGICYADCP
jgi:hypothetical protein